MLRQSNAESKRYVCASSRAALRGLSPKAAVNEGRGGERKRAKRTNRPFPSLPAPRLVASYFYEEWAGSANAHGQTIHDSDYVHFFLRMIQGYHDIGG